MSNITINKFEQSVNAVQQWASYRGHVIAPNKDWILAEKVCFSEEEAASPFGVKKEFNSGVPKLYRAITIGPECNSAGKVLVEAGDILIIDPSGVIPCIEKDGDYYFVKFSLSIAVMRKDESIAFEGDKEHKCVCAECHCHEE